MGLSRRRLLNDCIANYAMRLPVTSVSTALTQSPMANWFFYILRCADDSLYSGITTDLERRLREHNAGAAGARYTRSRRPVSLAYSERLPDRAQALRREHAVKQLDRAAKLQLLATPLPPSG